MTYCQQDHPSSSLNMVNMAQSDASAFKHSLLILLAEQASTDPSIMPQMKPDAYGSISSISLAKGCDEDQSA
jgi:hypothetical protein